jgi:pimeloyl-ACP methyl ester carboxylesterase
VSVEVPVDYRANTGAKIKIEYAVSFASGESKGILFYVVGGPGGSGIGVADDYLAAFDARLTENMDIVFFDQRGTGPDRGIECPKAQGIFDQTDMSVDKPDEAIAAAKTFAADCPAELKSRDLLGFVDTETAIRDLEEFRQKIGAPKVWVYGESYGTQFSQQYASLYPTAVKGVALDGVVDLALDFDAYYASYTEAAEKVLARVFAACGDIAACAKDMQGDAAAVYDALAAKAPIEIDYPRGDGTTVKRKLTPAMLDANAFYALYGPDDRATFLRALAAASRGELLPMMRLAYSNLAVDPETEEGVADPNWFGAAYYAITCTDYGEGTADSEATAARGHRAGQGFCPACTAIAALLFRRAAGVRVLAEARTQRAAEALCRRRLPDPHPQRRRRSDHADHHVLRDPRHRQEQLHGGDEERAACDLGPRPKLPGRDRVRADVRRHAAGGEGAGVQPGAGRQLYGADADRCGCGRRCFPGGAGGGDRDRAIAGARELGRRRPARGRLQLRRRGRGERREEGHRLHLHQVRLVAGPGARRQRHADRRGRGGCRADFGPVDQRRAPGADHLPPQHHDGRDDPHRQL